MSKRVRRNRRILLWMAAGYFLLFLFSFLLGRFQVPLSQVLRILFSPLIPMERTWTPEMQAAVWNIRLPRIVLASLVGCCLSVAGATYQGVFRNPMAAPDILGASSGAAFGAALAILLFGGGRVVPVSAFLCGFFAVVTACLIAAIAPGLSTMNLILAGIMMGSLFSAGTSTIKLVADPNNELPQIVFWLMGSLAGSRNETVLLALLPMFLGLTPLILMRYQMNLLTLEEEEARTLGVRVDLLRFLFILCATLVTAASVSVSGMIGWIGLVVPHLCRFIVGEDYRFLIPASCMMGAFLLLLADDVSRNLLTSEIPIGILCTLIGVPFFLSLLLRRRRTA